MLHKTFLLGADYNPEQWLDSPEILNKDIALMQKANCNVMTMGMFAWPFLEPADGIYTLEWLKEIVDKLYAAGIYTIMGTPSGARPRWLAQKYPSVLRVNENRQRMLFGERHNHCYTAPDYRRKVVQMNTQLAKTFANHPGVLLWHLSNEYGGECHCPLCQEAFRNWLCGRYGTLDKLNKVWNAAFWGHIYTDWSQVESPSPLGDRTLHGLVLDWRRFCCDQTMNFIKCETDAIRAVRKDAPVTVNMMYYTYDMNYFKFADLVDVVSWDSYPVWHNEDNLSVAADTAMYHDIMRSIKHKPFLLMESTPSVSNWQPVSRQKRPGANKLASLQAVAHGSDSVQFFQWRQSIGSSEKFHGAIVDHYGKEDTRTFAETAQLGKALQAINAVCGSQTKAEIAVVFDWENRWASHEARGPFNACAGYKEIVKKHYKGLWEQGVNIDFVDMEGSLDGYKLVCAPMLYMLRGKMDEKLRRFVEAGGTLLTGPYSGIVDENDLCYLGGTPHGLMDVLGLRTTELDGLHKSQSVIAMPVMKNDLKLTKSYHCIVLCEVVKPDTAQALLTYGAEYYKGSPVLTANHYGKGTAYYLCSDFKEPFYADLYNAVLNICGIERLLPFACPKGIEATQRTGGTEDYLFIQNFNDATCEFPFEMLVKHGWKPLYGTPDNNALDAFETMVLKRGKTI